MKPVLQYCVGNIFACSSCLYSSHPKEVCAMFYKGEQGFKIHRRNYLHANRIIQDDKLQSDSIIINCHSMNGFLIKQRESILFYQCGNLQPVNRIKIAIKFKKVGSQNKIINIKLSQNEQYLAVLVGNTSNKNEDQIE